MNYYKRHIGDYLRDTTHLTMLEHGAYNRLLDLYYLREGPLPSLAECQRLVGARTDEEKSAVAAVLKDFFAETDEGFKQTRCEKELAAYRAKADKNRLAGQKGGQSKRTPSERLANAQQTPSESNPNHKPLTTNQEPVEKDIRAARVPSLNPSDLVGLQEQTATEFLQHRKRKRAPLTQLAWDGICAEATKAGWSVEDAVRKCLARGWTGFEAAWVEKERAAPLSKQAALEARNRAAGEEWLRNSGAFDVAN